MASAGNRRRHRATVSHPNNFGWLFPVFKLFGNDFLGAFCNPRAAAMLAPKITISDMCTDLFLSPRHRFKWRACRMQSSSRQRIRSHRNMASRNRPCPQRQEDPLPPRARCMNPLMTLFTFPWSWLHLSNCVEVVGT